MAAHHNETKEGAVLERDAPETPVPRAAEAAPPQRLTPEPVLIPSPTDAAEETTAQTALPEASEAVPPRRLAPEFFLIRSPADAEEAAAAWMRFWGYDDARRTKDGADGVLMLKANALSLK